MKVLSVRHSSEFCVSASYTEKSHRVSVQHCHQEPEKHTWNSGARSGQRQILWASCLQGQAVVPTQTAPSLTPELLQCQKGMGQGRAGVWTKGERYIRGQTGSSKPSGNRAELPKRWMARKSTYYVSCLVTGQGGSFTARPGRFPSLGHFCSQADEAGLLLTALRVIFKSVIGNPGTMSQTHLYVS